MTGGAVERVRGRARDEGQREEAAVHHGTNERSGPRAAPLRRSVALSRKGGLNFNENRVEDRYIDIEPAAPL